MFPACWRERKAARRTPAVGRRHGASSVREQAGAVTPRTLLHAGGAS
jgi:hypothetical protein